jgi:hypothetical protein
MNIWKPSSMRIPNTAVMVIDNRIFLLGLDELYRTAMKRFEGEMLLPCARIVAQKLQVQPSDVPIEGYYYETAELQEYFRLMRGLQEQSEDSESRVRDLREFQLLWDVTSSPLYGRPQRKGKLFPVGRDPLTQALEDTIPNWNVERLVKAAYAATLQYNDISLVGLAARIQDAVVLAAVRESVVLYDEVATLGIHKEPELQYEWRVDEALVDAANRFIETFNRFVPGALPRAESTNAEQYYKAYADNELFGRCVRIGKTPDGSQHYHWAIAVKQLSRYGFELGVDEFWSEHIWTTKKYRKAQGSPTRMEFFQMYGVPEYEYEWL